jgi:hypothetical protein
MAYASKGETRVNYYSSPLITYSGLPTGDARNDNLRRLAEIRFMASKIGNESMSCPATTTSTSSSSSSGQTAVATTSCVDLYRNCPVGLTRRKGRLINSNAKCRFLKK